MFINAVLKGVLISIFYIIIVCLCIMIKYLGVKIFYCIKSIFEDKICFCIKSIFEDKMRFCIKSIFEDKLSTCLYIGVIILVIYYFEILKLLLVLLFIFIVSFIIKKFKDKKKARISNEGNLNLKENLKKRIREGATGEDILNIVNKMGETSVDDLIRDLRDIGTPNLKKLKYILKKDMENKNFKDLIKKIGIGMGLPVFSIISKKIKISKYEIDISEGFKNKLIEFLNYVATEDAIVTITGVVVTLIIAFAVDKYLIIWKQKIPVGIDFYLEIIDEIIDEGK